MPTSNLLLPATCIKPRHAAQRRLPVSGRAALRARAEEEEPQQAESQAKPQAGEAAQKRRSVFVLFKLAWAELETPSPQADKNTL